MRFRRTNAVIVIPLFLLLRFSAATGQDVPYEKNLANQIDTRKYVARDGPLVDSLHGSVHAELERGTKDAPVDGLDGKPHKGPFVYSSSDADDKESSTKKYSKTDRLKPEDGVMNDPNRQPPKKGTTGTEGGMTEKDRDRKAQEWESGEKKAKVPDAPKEVPGSSQVDPKNSAKDKIFEPSDHAPAPNRAKENFGIEKPTDLPEKVPVYDADSALETDFDSSAQSDDWLPSGSEPSEEEGAHDLVRWDSLLGSFLSIAATEIGDKTFIVAALMAMRYSGMQVFFAAYSALFVMTILSGVAGHAVGALISKRWAATVAAALFLIFGAKSIKEGLEMSPDQGVSDEMKEVEAELEGKEVGMARQSDGRRRGSSISPYNLEAGRGLGPRRSRSRSQLARKRSPSTSPERSPSPSRTSMASVKAGARNLLSLLLSPAMVETFSMTFIGELGDRSQIATVAMAAGQEYLWVMVGALAGHAICTCIAVVGGSLFAGRVSMRKVTLAGGAVFLIFGLFTMAEAYHYWF